MASATVMQKVSGQMEMCSESAASSSAPCRLPGANWRWTWTLGRFRACRMPVYGSSSRPYRWNSKGESRSWLKARIITSAPLMWVKFPKETTL